MTMKQRILSAALASAADEAGCASKQKAPAEDLGAQSGYSCGSLAAVDSFGRTVTSVSGLNSEKQVGMFFWLWLGQPYTDDIYDAAKIRRQYGDDVLFHQSSAVSPSGQEHWWGEPLWGYYNSADEYVIRRQMELLTMAGVDFIYFDTTNAETFPQVCRKVLKVISELRAQGWKAPQAAFYTHSLSMKTTRKLYEEIYRPGLYKDSWYLLNGKPMIIAYTDPAQDKAESASRGVKPGENGYIEADYAPFSREILDFFTFKRPQWPTDPSYEDGFPWVSWDFPQKKSGGVMNVTVASHPGVPMSFSLTRPGHINWGRGWDVRTQKNVESDVLKGTFFQSCWDYAIAQDPKMISVGGWNEWVAYKQLWDGEYMLCDAASLEYSRDIEMMKGGYEDAYYLQLIRNIRRYKGKTEKTEGQKPVTIDISADREQWKAVTAVYRSIGAENYGRDSRACTAGVTYKQAAPRNNLREVRVAHDDSFLYFLITAEKKITGSGENWMNLFLGTGTPSLKGWQGYEYRVNRSTDGKTGSVERMNGDFTGTQVARADYTVNGNLMQIRVSRDAVGLSKDATFYFKAADGVSEPSDIMDYYVTGKCLPMGRCSWQYTAK